MTVLIAGAGIGGLTLGLTLHQIGVPFRIFEATKSIKPMGVGINIQPNAVRELCDLGLAEALETVGIKTQQYGFYTKRGLPIWEEPRGMKAGYAWPQYSVHRGKLQMMLYQALIDRAGDVVETDTRVTGVDGATLITTKGRFDGQIIVAADGIHSALRAQFNPDEGPPIWDGAILWRAMSRAKPFFGEGAMALIGHDTQRIVAYPISGIGTDGLVDMNWIAELRVDPASGWRKEDWNRAADKADFAPLFDEWVFDWLDVPALIASADQVFEYPMVDRDPLDQWTHGHVTLLGDAAHPTYPVGSNGATQAIVDARVLGAAILKHGLNEAALQAYEAQMRPLTTNVIMANRGSGPDAILQQVEDLCEGQFNHISDVMAEADLKAHADRYKALAGTSIDVLNAKPRLIEEGAQYGG